jgi:hypothetical protein
MLQFSFFSTHIPNLSNQNKVFIWYSVLIGCFSCTSTNSYSKSIMIIRPDVLNKKFNSRSCKNIYMHDWLPDRPTLLFKLFRLSQYVPSWSYCSLKSNYLFNQLLSHLKMWVQSSYPLMLLSQLKMWVQSSYPLMLLSQLKMWVQSSNPLMLLSQLKMWVHILSCYYHD